MTVSRRRFLGLLGGAGVAVTGLAGIAGLAAGCSGGTSAAGSGQTGELLTSRLPLPKRFAVALPIPPVKDPTSTDATTDYVEIVQRESDVEIVPGYQTRIFGYDGIFPGPTLRSRRGRRTVVTHRNELTVPTVVHLHGGHTPAESDGYPIDLIMPSDPMAAAAHSGHGGSGGHSGHGAMVGAVTEGSRDYTYPLDQPAATLWYHDHRMDFTAPQVWFGLAGFHLVHDDVEDGLPLPRDERDIPLMICDRAFEADGSFRYPALDPELHDPPGVEADYMEGVLGDVILVNGAPWPVLEVEAARYRLRLLNASNARRYRLTLDPGGEPFVQIGSDGGLLERPQSHAAIEIAPAERFDVIVDFSAYPVGTEITLRNALGSASTADVMRFVVTRKGTDGSAIPKTLTEIEPLDPSAAVGTREWRFTRGKVGDHDGWTINDKAFDPARMDATPRLGDIEIWRFSSDLHHPVHVHLSPFQVVGRGNSGPGPMDAGWKDTVDVRPVEYVDVAIRFTDYAGKFLMHCHNLEHEDMAMMAAFETR